MVKLNISMADIMSDPHLSVTSSPFAPGKVIIKRASFPKGVTPPHLVGRAFPRGGGVKGVVIYKGRPMPRNAARHGKSYRGK